MKLRAKILAGFFILVLILTISIIWTITELNMIGTSVNKLLDENYKSINAAKMMIEALERQDSGILLLLLGKTEEGDRIINSGDSLFQRGFEIASHNVTIRNEDKIIDDIKLRYNKFTNMLNKPIILSEKVSKIDWYLNNTHKYFNDVKEVVNELMNLNDKTMFNSASELQNKSRRSLMPGIVSILAALLFSLIFTYLVNYFFISPVIRMTNGVKNFVEHSSPYLVKIETNDEIRELSGTIENLCKISQMMSREK